MALSVGRPSLWLRLMPLLLTVRIVLTAVPNSLRFASAYDESIANTHHGLHLRARNALINKRRITNDHRLTVSQLQETILPRKTLMTYESLNDPNTKTSKLSVLRRRDQSDGSASHPVMEQLIRRRRALTFPSFFWKRDVNGQLTVDYDFADEYINRTVVEAALANWEKNTCVRFRKISPPATNPYMIMIPPSHTPYVNFVGAGYSCHTYTGVDSRLEGPHHVFLSPLSCGYAAAVHEIGHVFGVVHEHSRWDRGSYIAVLDKDIMSGMQSEFVTEVASTYGVPYDYYSVMQFNPAGFSNGRGPTMRALNPRYQSLMGSEEGLSFMDAKSFNLAYQCIDDWKAQCNNEDPCLNQGYIKYHGDSKTCVCVCPAGTQGDHCQTKTMEYNDALAARITPYTKVVTKPGQVTTPNFPKPYGATQFTQVLQAPHCQLVVLTMDRFKIHPRRADTGICDFDSMEVRRSTSLDAGTMYCGSEIEPGQRFKSEQSTLILHFMTYFGAKEDDFMYQGSVSFEDIPNCS